MNRRLLLCTLSVCCLARFAIAEEQPSDGGPLPPAATTPVDFVRDVQPLFVSRCYKCHGPNKQTAGLALHRKVRALAGGDDGPVLVPGKSADSRLIQFVAGVDRDHVMPPDAAKRLTPEEVGLLRAWIDQGASWPAEADKAPAAAAEHWAYRKPVRPPLPTVKDAAWVRNGIDAFILARLDKEGLHPAPEADRATLLRRVSLDLTGLPPSIPELDTFLADPAPDAYEKVVDRLLTSPRYGERWARPWLDLARYADTNGYEKDRPRSLWLWRDWVIGALNDDMPFDQFTIEQLAGDLLPNATTRQRVATGFHRNTLLNDEGGINPEEFRIVAVKDRVDTTAAVWLGTTLECAQCHSHKYDPFTQKEYYQFLAYFNQTADSGVGNGPELPVPTPAEQQQLDRINGEITALEKSLRDHDAHLAEAQLAWEEKVLAGPLPEAPPQEGLYLHWPLNGVKDKRAEDASGHERHGTYTGKEAVTGGGALRFTGSGANGAIVDGGNVADFERTDKFSYGCWVRPETNDGCLLSRIDDPQAYRGYDLYFNNGRFEVHLVHNWPNNGLKVATKKTFEQNRWYHVFVTCDGSAKAAGVRLHLNGKPEPVNIENDTLTDTIRTAIPFKVGRRQVMGSFKGLLSDVRVYDRVLTDAEVAALAARHPALDIVSIPREQRTPQQQGDLAAYYRTLDPERGQIEARIAERKTALAKVKPATTMVMQEVTKARENYVMMRGNFAQKGKKVEPGMPGVLHPLPEGAPPNRLGLARWLVDEENPLVGRVTVNRFWEAYFGRGLVLTPEDFGSQGERPTHPELLDWLAVDFRERGWSMKELHRLLVTSATYRQSSRASEDLFRRDPFNLLYARGPRLRVEYEMLRDLSLAAGGLLSGKIGGPSVMPPQPPGIWEHSFGFYDLPDFRWKEATGDDRYRRGIYTFLRRTALYPAFTMFDAPTRDVCSVKRSRTNTPLQALATLNDPVFVEAAGGLARRILIEASGGVEERATFAFRVCAGRKPEPRELEALVALYRKALARYEKDPKAAMALAKHGRVDATGLSVEQLAAWTVVANVLLNMDETLTKG
jgi:mono/diheme cytochrome c family protein